MAKELPYFKFEPGEWENGSIQILSRELKGLFIDLCCLYWSRLGDLPFKLAVQKLCAGNATALDSLCEEKIISIKNDNIYIEFLSEQLQEFDDISKKNKINALLGWEKRRKIKGINATAEPPHSERNAIREDKRKEDKIFNFKNSLLNYGFDKKLVSDWLKVRKNKKATNTETSFNKFISQVEKSKLKPNEVLKICVEKDWKGFEVSWLDNNKQEPGKIKLDTSKLNLG